MNLATPGGVARTLNLLSAARTMGVRSGSNNAIELCDRHGGTYSDSCRAGRQRSRLGRARKRHSIEDFAAKAPAQWLADEPVRPRTGRRVDP
jgi:hypothetical protein